MPISSSSEPIRRRPSAWRRVSQAVVVLLAIAIAALAVLAWLGYRDDSSTGPREAVGDPAQQVAYGAYLAKVGDCMACHTAPGSKPYAGGAAIPTPFGTFYGPNITADAATGIGNWTADDFWRALHQGKGPSGTLLYPAFPYTEYTRITRADADALYAYLRSIPPVTQPSRPHELDFPYGWRPLLALWRGLYFKPGVHADARAAVPAFAAADAVVPDRPALIARGRYLVDGLGHCVACHAPRNALGATAQEAGLPGGDIAGLGWYAPALDGAARTGLGGWSEDDIVMLLKTGTGRHGAAAGPMAEVVVGSTQYLSDVDAQAIAAYLKTIPAPSTGDAPVVRAAGGMRRGAALYEQHCAQCHGAEGQGRGRDWPPLAGNIGVVAPYPGNAIQMVLAGGFAPATAANPQPHGMPPFGQVLSDDDVAAVVTYIRNSWGNAAGGVTSLQVKQARAVGG
ncbi:c-type cytochrome [Bordetella flabilis]|uniref:Alcohol dehydrogenase n=1 Tax=Bordetella flabilis TaxID=463014 RepID=A0A193G939_9BORD|nr:cytochrome c [Bordetella flabilis]ANN75981.1 alcohol dehydrogenase [Bordetella flabilis]